MMGEGEHLMRSSREVTLPGSSASGTASWKNNHETPFQPQTIPQTALWSSHEKYPSAGFGEWLEELHRAIVLEAPLKELLASATL